MNEPQKVELIDDKGNLIHSFESQSQVAKYLKTTSATISRKLNQNQPFTLNGGIVYIRKAVVSPHSKGLHTERSTANCNLIKCNL